MATPSPSGKPGGLTGLRVVSFESRRAPDMAAALRRHGGDVLHAPSMREVPLADERGILDFGARLFEGACDALVLLTGVGTTILVDALSTRWPRAAVLERLGRTPLICSSSKAATVVARLGLKPAVLAPEPGGPQQLLRQLDDSFDVRDKRVYVQEYGSVSIELLQGLEARGARVTAIQIYRWALPDDTRELKSALGGIAQRRVDAALFTSAHQVENVLDYAERLQIGAAVLDALRRWVLVVALGPVTREALRRRGVAADLVADQPKRARLVAGLAASGAQLLRAKRGRA